MQWLANINWLPEWFDYHPIPRTWFGETYGQVLANRAFWLIAGAAGIWLILTKGKKWMK